MTLPVKIMGLSKRNHVPFFLNDEDAWVTNKLYAKEFPSIEAAQEKIRQTDEPNIYGLTVYID